MKKIYFIDESLDRGISLITTIGNQEWTNNLSQINKIPFKEIVPVEIK